MILIKTGIEDYHMGHYFLNDINDFAIGSTDFMWCKTSAGKPKYKISKQNCDEIFGVVDIEMLAVLTTKEETTFVGNEKMAKGFIKGYNKAMELNKDKLFTVEDMKKAYIQGKHGGKTQSYVEFDDFIQSLQQPTEIEVEIEMEKVVDETKMIGVVKGVKGSGNKITTYKSVPKLDENDCLILKKK